MAIDLVYASGNAVNISTSEISLVSGTTSLQTKTDSGMYQLFLDSFNMVKGDEFVVKLKEKAIAAGTQRKVIEAVLSDAQSEMFAWPPMLLGAGWDMTIVRTTGIGADRTFSWSIRRVS